MTKPRRELRQSSKLRPDRPRDRSAATGRRGFVRRWRGGQEGSLTPPRWAPIRYTRAEVLFQLGRYDEAERWFLTADRFWSDQFLAPRFRRLAQIADRRGDKVKSIAYYERFIDLWSDCDPDLRPQVEEARARLLALRGN